MEGQVAGRLVADVEVLVEPAVRRRNQTARLPGRDDLVFAFLPHDRVALAGGDDDRPARAVAVGLLVGA